MDGIEVRSGYPHGSFAANETYLLFANIYSVGQSMSFTPFGEIDLGRRGIFTVDAQGTIQSASPDLREVPIGRGLVEICVRNTAIR